MGMYLNPGKKSYEIAIRSEIFVDKSEMINELNAVVNTNQRFVSVSRPRRFGKTMAADMACAYYDREADSHALFEELKLSSCEPGKSAGRILPWDVFLGQFDVIRIVMTDFFAGGATYGQAMEKMQKLVCRDIRKKYPDADYFDLSDLPLVMADAYEYSKRQFVVIIDEWDAIFRTFDANEKSQTHYLGFLRNLLKNKEYIALAYMTGILPIKKYGEHSALNMFREYSMMAPMQLAPYTGFTEDEVKKLCRRYGRDYKVIKEWYDGYTVSGIVPSDPYHEANNSGDKPAAEKYSLYNPLSVVEAVTTGKIADFWNKTETYKALEEYIRKNLDGLKDAIVFLMDGGKLVIDTTTYQNDMTTFTGKDDVFSLLVHLGYLGFDDEKSEIFIPNREILDEFRASTKSREWTTAFHAYETSSELLKATWAHDADKVASLLEVFHNKADSKTYNDEATLSWSVQMAYYAAQKYYTTILELGTGKGYADIVYLPAPDHADLPVLLIELKYEKNADAAISQIHRQNYPDRLEHYKGNILLVGINYDKGLRNEDPAFKHHTCKIEKV